MCPRRRKRNGPAFSWANQTDNSMSQQELFPEIKRKRKRKAAACTVPDDAPLVLNLSGGRTSGYMLWRQLQEQRPDYVLFGNTGKEREETLVFLNEIETRWQVPVVWLEYTRGDSAIAKDERGHGFRVVNFETASRNGEPLKEILDWMPSLPNVRARGCTTQGKVRTMGRFLRWKGLTTWRAAIGIRNDEADRMLDMLADFPSYIRPEFPLVKAGVKESDVMAFWAQQPFDLQLQQHEGNCDGCFLKASWKLLRIEKDKPGTLGWWAGEEANAKARGCRTGAQFREDRTYAGLLHVANHPSLWPEDEDVSCNCMSGGWKEYDSEQIDDTEKPAA